MKEIALRFKICVHEYVESGSFCPVDERCRKCDKVKSFLVNSFWDRICKMINPVIKGGE